jgi:hypothetical protein
MKRLEILHTDPIGLVRSHDIDQFLGNFCSWQKDENPPRDSDPLHWDHALILTGLDLYVLSKNGKLSRQVVGRYQAKNTSFAYFHSNHCCHSNSYLKYSYGGRQIKYTYASNIANQIYKEP